MNARHPLLFATLLVSLPLAIAGCGNKGPLVMAEEPAPIESPATPAGTVPVEIETPKTLPTDEPTDALVDPTADDPTLTVPASTTVDPVDDAASDSEVDPEAAPVPDEPTSGTTDSGAPVYSKRIPIDPATVPDSPPATGTADDDDG